MTLNYTPTQLEIKMKAAAIFPGDAELQNSFIQGVYHTIYITPSTKTPKNA